MMILYRRFEKEEYLNSFVNGEIRFRLIKAYREPENSNSADIDELIYKGSACGVMEIKELGNHVYGLCLTKNLESTKKFGTHVAVINDVEAFILEIKEEITKNNISIFGDLLYGNVLYDKGESLAEQKGLDNIRRIVFQKSSAYADESEFRIAFLYNQKLEYEVNEVITIRLTNKNLIQIKKC